MLLGNIKELAQDVVDDMNNPSYAMVSVNSRLSLNERFNGIRANYRAFQRLVDDGKRDWMCDDPYQIADWISIFTPIEASAWGAIRGADLPLWPQLPVGAFFVDFGNPKKCVALECDGASYHNVEKDAQRDAELNAMGWSVYRAPGWMCNKMILPPCEIRARDEVVPDEYEVKYKNETIDGFIASIKHQHFA